MAAQTVRISEVFTQIQSTSEEVQEAVVETLSLVAYLRRDVGYPLAARAADRALSKAETLLQELHKLRSALGRIIPPDAQSRESTV